MTETSATTTTGVRGRHPAAFASFTMDQERARGVFLEDRATANLIVTFGTADPIRATVADLPQFLPAGSLVVFNTSGTFNARVTQVLLPDGSYGTVHFAQMLEDTAMHWIVVAPDGLRTGDVLSLPGGARLMLLRPHLVRGQQPRWEEWGQLWVARLHGPDCFDHYHPQYAVPIQYPYDTLHYSLPDLQNACSGRPTSAMMNNGGRNITADVIDNLLAKGVQLAQIEMRTGVGVDHEGIPLPEYVGIDIPNAAIINAALARGAQIVPVGTGVIRALDFMRRGGVMRPGQALASNIITPENGGTWLNAWVSGLHEPVSTHLALGSAVMGEEVMLRAMLTAYDWEMYFHENGDTHLHLPGHLMP